MVDELSFTPEIYREVILIDTESALQWGWKGSMYDLCMGMFWAVDGD